MLTTSSSSNPGVTPKFEWRTKEDKLRSKQEGKPVFKEVAYVVISIAGDNKNIVSRKATDQDKNRWPEHWRAFEEDTELQIEGTPLKELEVLDKNPSRITELNALKIYTVEALAQLPDGHIKNLGMDGRQLVNKAQAYIEHKGGNAAAEKIQGLENENKELKDQLETLQAQVSELIKAQKPVKKKAKTVKESKNESTNDLPERSEIQWSD